jgi:hypothetical protein
MDKLEEKAMEYRPKMIICGASAYPRDWDYKRFRQIADKVWGGRGLGAAAAGPGRAVGGVRVEGGRQQEGWPGPAAASAPAPGHPSAPR